MIYDREKVENRLELIQGIQRQIDEMRDNYKELDELRDLNKENISNINKEFEKEKENINIKLEEKLNNMMNKASQEKEIDINILDETLTKVSKIREKYNEKFGENIGEIESYKINEPENLKEGLRELNDLYSEIIGYIEGEEESLIVSIKEKVGKIWEYVESNIGERFKLVKLVIIVVIMYIMFKKLLNSSIRGRVILITQWVVILGVILLIKRKIKEKTVYGSKGKVFKAYKLVEYIEKECEKEKMNIEKAYKRRLNKAESTVNKLKIDQEIKITKMNRERIEDSKKAYKERVEKVDLDDKVKIPKIVGEKIKLCELPRLVKVKIIDDKYDIYLGLSNVVINSQCKDKARELMNNIINELQKHNKGGNLKLRLVDRIGLGKNYIGVLNNKDVQENIYIIDEDINKMLDEVIESMGRNIREKLSGEYETITDYNENNKEKIDYEYIFIHDMDKISDEEILQKIDIIAQHSIECGVVLVITGKNIKDYIEKERHIIEIEDDGGMVLEIYKDKKLNYDVENIN